MTDKSIDWEKVFSGPPVIRIDKGDGIFMHSDKPEDWGKAGTVYNFAEQTEPHKFIIHKPNFDPLVEINLTTGAITYGPDYTPDEAAKIFWDAIEAMGLIRTQNKER